MLDETASIVFEVNYATTAGEMCKRLNQRYKASSDDSGKRDLYVALAEASKIPLTQLLLRRLRHDESVLAIHVILKQKQKSHSFYALPEVLAIKPERRPQKVVSEKFFTEGNLALI